MRRLALRGLAALAIALSFGAAVVSSISLTAAQEAGAHVNGAALCPPGLENDAIDPLACARPAIGIEFYIANPGTGNVEFGTTGGDGLVGFPLDRFALSPEGTVVEVGAILNSDPYGIVTGLSVACNQNGEPAGSGVIEGEVQPGGASLATHFTVFEGDQISCEWFFSHQGEDGTETGDPPIAELPATGAGAAQGSNSSTPMIGPVLAAAITGLLAIATCRMGIRTE